MSNNHHWDILSVQEISRLITAALICHSACSLKASPTMKTHPAKVADARGEEGLISGEVGKERGKPASACPLPALPPPPSRRGWHPTTEVIARARHHLGISRIARPGILGGAAPVPYVCGCTQYCNNTLQGSSARSFFLRDVAMGNSGRK